MSKNAASEGELGELHSTLAKTLKKMLSIETVTKVITDDQGEQKIVEEDYQPPASVLAVAANFLKQNEITAQAESNAELDDLNRALEARKAKRQFLNTSPQDDAEGYVQ